MKIVGRSFGMLLLLEKYSKPVGRWQTDLFFQLLMFDLKGSKFKHRHFGKLDHCIFATMFGGLMS